MAKHPTHSRKKSNPSRNKSNQGDSAAEVQVQVPRQSSLRLPVALILILIVSLGAWGYVRWNGAGVMDDGDEIVSDAGGDVAAGSPEAVPTALPSWQRVCSGSVCAVSQEDLSESWIKMDDAGQDGWETEVFSDAATKQFKKLKEGIAQGKIDDSAIAYLVDEQATIGRLVPAQLQTTFQDATTVVHRAAASTESATGTTAAERRGAAGLAESLAELLDSFTRLEALKMKIKVFRVGKDGNVRTTQQTLEIFGETETGVKEVNAIWSACWTSDRVSPRLLDLRLVEFESAERKGRTLFSDCTESAIASSPSFGQQLQKGFNHWLDRSQAQRYLDLIGAPGIAIGDVNEDGLEDVYVCQEEGLPNLMLIQQPDGTLEDASEASGTNWLESSHSALIVDFNNDGHNDLAVALEGGIALAAGSGNGQFQYIHFIDTVEDVISTLAAADYDMDGRLDVYAGVYNANNYDPDKPNQDILISNFIYYDSRNGGANSLWRNECESGQWNFSDVTGKVGLDQDNNRMTLAAAWEDLDNDGDQDLYVANDFGPNNLFRNDLRPDGSRHFVDIAFEAGAEDSASGMAVTFSDYDHDGWMDIYVSNMFSYAGNRIMFQDQFKSDADDKLKEVFRRFARGNTLLRNLGLSDTQPTLKFEDRSLEAAVNQGRWAWGSLFLDLNNDSWDDLIVANGFITTEDSGDL